MVKKKKKNESIEAFKPAFATGVLGVSLLKVGQGTNSLLPAGIQNPISSVGVSATSVSGTLGILGGTGLIVKQLKKLKRRKNK